MSLKFSWPEQEFFAEITEFDFEKKFGESSPDKIYCGEFSKAIETEDFELQIVHFKSFRLIGGMLIFYTFGGQNSSLDIKGYEGLELKIIEPGKFVSFQFQSYKRFLVPVPLPLPMNRIVTHGNAIIYAQLFIKMNDNTKYVCAIKGKWNQFSRIITSALKDRNYGIFGISVDLIGERKIGGKDKKVYASELFSKFPMHEVKKFYIIVVQSEIERKINIGFLNYFLILKHLLAKFLYKRNHFPLAGVRNALKSIVRKSATLLVFDFSQKTKILCRRLIGACLNGGLALDLIDEIRIEVNDTNVWNLSSADFLQEDVDFSISMESNLLINNILKTEVHNLKFHLMNNSLEAQYRSIFWDQLLSNLFHNFQTSDERPVYRLQSEWDTKNLFPSLEQRFVDWVALYKIAGIEIPILNCEMGFLPFELGINCHKDFSKLLATISHSCIKLSKLLESNGKYAEEARIFGFWIGGTKIQLVTARAIVSGDPGNLQIHANISFKPIWMANVLNTEATTLEIESMAPSESTNNDNLDDLNLNIEEIVIVQKSQKSIEPVFNDNLNEETLSKLYSCIGHIINRMKFLSSEASNRPANTPPRTFKCHDEGGFIPESRVEGRPTPKRSRVELPERSDYDTPRTPSGQVSRSPSPLRYSEPGDYFKNEERTKLEFELYRKHFYHVPSFFPKLYKALDNPAYVDYYDFYFERMLPFMNFYDMTFIDLLNFSSFEEGLIKYFNFAINLLNCLDYLHSEFKLVHSDISPTNIMYSEEFQTWKLNDFGQTMTLEASSKKSRIAGTVGYISPESFESGIFNEASDIFALGTVFLNFFYHDLKRQESTSEALCDALSEYQSVILAMTDRDPTCRPTAGQALLKLFKHLLKFKNSFSSSHAVYIRVGSLYCEQLEAEKSASRIEDARIAVIEQKEASKLTTQTKPEHEDILYSVKLQ